MREEVRTKVNGIIAQTPAHPRVTISLTDGGDPIVGYIEDQHNGELVVLVEDEFGRERLVDVNEEIIDDVVAM